MQTYCVHWTHQCMIPTVCTESTNAWYPCARSFMQETAANRTDSLLPRHWQQRDIFWSWTSLTQSSRIAHLPPPPPVLLWRELALLPSSLTTGFHSGSPEAQARLPNTLLQGWRYSYCLGVGVGVACVWEDWVESPQEHELYLGQYNKTVVMGMFMWGRQSQWTILYTEGLCGMWFTSIKLFQNISNQEISKIQEKLTTKRGGGYWAWRKLKSSRKWKRIFLKDLGFQDEESTRERKGGWK